MSSESRGLGWTTDLLGGLVVSGSGTRNQEGRRKNVQKCKVQRTKCRSVNKKVCESITSYSRPSVLQNCALLFVGGFGIKNITIMGRVGVKSWAAGSLFSSLSPSAIILHTSYRVDTCRTTLPHLFVDLPLSPLILHLQYPLHPIHSRTSIIHTSIHPYIHTSIHPYIHTSIHTDTQTPQERVHLSHSLTPSLCLSLPLPSLHSPRSTSFTPSPSHLAPLHLTTYHPLLCKGAFGSLGSLGSFNHPRLVIDHRLPISSTHIIIVIQTCHFLILYNFIWAQFRIS
jgi:hypothetical protein